jgi:outer membrane protein assembly factor BamD (BamD/ComL family)
MPVQPATQSASDAPRPNARSSLPRSSSDSLAEEVRLVSKAEQQLSAGRADDALKTLSEHERRFPNGALTELRMAARVQSLCTPGRIAEAEARADLTKLARAYPQSPQLDRTRRFCAIDTP